MPSKKRVKQSAWDELIGKSEPDAEDVMRDASLAEKQAHIQRAYDAVLATSEGQIVLRHIYEETGYSDRLTTLNQHTLEINQLATNYNFARRDLWLDIVRFMTPRQRMLIEFQGER